LNDNFPFFNLTHLSSIFLTRFTYSLHSGQFLLVANQDSDNITVFSFNLTTGEMKYTGNEYRVPSPNFVCCCPMIDRDLGGYQENQADALAADDTRSTVPTLVEFDRSKKNSLDLQSELETARKEIAELKTQLSAIDAHQ